MAGHSKWSNIKFRKRSQDNKRSKIFNKISNDIMQAISSNGSTENNAKLKTLINKALSLNMPKRNIDKAIERGKINVKIKDKSLELFYSKNIAIIINYDSCTDKQTELKIKNALIENKCSIVKTGSCNYIFHKKYKIIIKLVHKNKIEKIKSSLNIESYIEKRDLLEVIINDTELSYIESCLLKNDVSYDSIVTLYIAKSKIYITENEMGKLNIFIKNISKITGVKNIFSNVGKS